MSVPTTIVELVDRFSDNKKDYHASTYKEYRLRKEFIDPFFEAIGWDVGNKDGLAEAYKDVIHEDSLKIAGRSKAPDYAFRIGGTRKFFVEAKLPAVGIKKDAASAYQLRRYGWSAKLPLSILTDFEGFAVYDCRIKPKLGESAGKARILYVPYTEYLTRWAEIAGVFARQSILKGAFDRYSAAKKAGTAEVDNAFLAEIEIWRESLAKSIARRNTLSVRDLNTAVQRTIDRIIFLRIAEARGFEPEGTLEKASKGAGVYKRLADLFRKADDRYNSGLFHFRKGDGSGETLDTFSLNLTIEDKPLKELLLGLYFPQSPYEFSVLPADILGQVYEQFLGKVITLGGKQVTIEEKPEVKKAGGVFYTPTYIARYIVSSTLRRALLGKTPAQASGKKPVRIVDPACGSGSFLIEAYQYLLDWYLEKYLDESAAKHSKGKNSKLYKNTKGDWRLTIAEKRRLLITHIYGVDIDTQAVEVTKLSLLMKVLEGESGDALAAQTSLFKVRALPDLGDNIKCGNSLVASDVFASETPVLFTEEDRIVINSFDWDSEFAFRFDVVIGNPPYGAGYTQDDKRYFQQHYSYKEGKPETYIYFIEKGLQIAKISAVVSFIVPNAWLTNYYGIQIRDLLLKKSSLLEVVDLEPARVFKAAVVDTCIITVANQVPASKNAVKIRRVQDDKSIIDQFDVNQEDWAKDPEHLFNVYATAADLKVMRKMQAGKQTFDDVLEFSQGVIPYLTKAQGEDNAHIGPTKKGSGWLPLYESAAQVEKYKTEPTAAFINYGPWLNRSREERFFLQPKILFHRVRKKLAVQLVGAIDEQQSVNRHALSNLILKPGRSNDELWAVLALFNSDLANWWFIKRYGPLMEVGGFKVMTVPIPRTWAEFVSALAAAAKDVTKTTRRLPTLHSEHERTVVTRTIAASRKSIEVTLAKAFGLEAADTDQIALGTKSFRYAETIAPDLTEDELSDA